MAATAQTTPASGAALQIGRIREAAFGTTPDTPTLTAVRKTSLQMAPNVENFVSDETNANRVITAIRNTYLGPAFQINSPLIYGNSDSLMEQALLNEFAANTLTEGNVFLSDTLEGFYADASTPFYQIIRGAAVQGMTFNFDSGGQSAATVQFTGIGKTWDVAEASVSASAYTAAPTTEPMVGAESSIEINDSVHTVVSGSLTVTPQLEALRALGNKGPAFIAANGNRTVTGQLVAYLTDKTWLQRLKDGEAFKVAYKVADAETGGNSYAFTVATAKATNVRPDEGAGTTRVTIDWQAFNAAGGSTLSITKTEAS